MRDKKIFADMFLYPTVLVVGFFIRALPPAVGLRLAGMLGAAVYLFYGKRRRIGYVNIKAAFCDRFSPKQIRKVTRMTFQHFAQVLFEVFRFPDIDKGYADRYVASEGLSRIEDALKKGRGAIILTGHFGNWELSGLVGAIRGYPQDVLARQQRYQRLNVLLNSYRERYGRHVIEKGMATREIITALKTNKVVAILSDQDGGMKGSLVNFFGRLASTPQGATAFALKFDSAILPNFCIRQKGPFYRLVVEEPLELEKTGDTAIDIQANLQKFTDILQSYITRYPSQWLWLHKRWKTTPSRRILIISDSKAGHLNQSRAAAKQIRKTVFERAGQDKRITLLKRALPAMDIAGQAGMNHEPSTITLEDLIYQERIIEVKYRSPVHKAILAICSLFASKNCQGCMRCVKFCLTSDSYGNLMAVYADIVVSCGSSLAPVNRFLCIENMAKGVVVNKPGILPARKFNLCIIPRHDKPKRQPNVLITEGALNLIDVVPRPTELSIGLLIGGDTKDFILAEDDMRNVLDAVVEFSEQANAGLMATTSRRTPKDIDGLVKLRLSAVKNCKQLIIANEKNVPQAVADILGASDIVIVSGESVSMVSEAASSGKKVIVFQPQPRKPNSRHFRFLKNLQDKGFIALCRPEDIFDTVKAASQDEKPQKILNDNALVYEAVKRIL